MARTKVASMKSGLTMSTCSERTMSIVNMDTIAVSHDNSVSSVLLYCKQKVLSPYFRLTSFLGWRPLLSPTYPSSSPSNLSGPGLESSTSLPAPTSQSFTTLISFFNLLINWCITAINLIYTLLILVLIFSAYFLSYCTCYRGDGLPHLLPLINASNNHQGNTNAYTNNLTPNNTHPIGFSLKPDYLSSPSLQPQSNHNWSTFQLVNDADDLPYFNRSITKSTTESPLTINNTIELISNSNTCNNKLISHFVIPDLLHFASYLYLLYLLRTPECERLENLMERGFLQLSQTTNWFLESRHLISILRSFLLLSTLWIICSLILHIVHFNITLVNFNCLPDSLGVNLALHLPLSDCEEGTNCTTTISNYLSTYHHYINTNHLHTILIYITVSCLTVFDIICSAVVTSYAVHCQLNISFINSVCQGVREKRIRFEEFYQRAEEARKFVTYLNNNQAVCVSLVAIVFICKICLYSFQLLSKFNNLTSYSLLILSAILWIIILLIPMIQGVRLTESCSLLRNLGHELKARPFGYQHTDESELNSLLAYTSSLDMKAKLFNLPIRSSSVVLIFSLILIGVPLFGQIGLISL